MSSHARNRAGLLIAGAAVLISGFLSAPAAAQEKPIKIVPEPGTKLGLGLACGVKNVGFGHTSGESAGAIVELDADGEVRPAALKKVGELGGPSELPELLGLLKGLEASRDIGAAEGALIAVCAKAEQPESYTGQVAGAMAGATPGALSLRSLVTACWLDGWSNEACGSSICITLRGTITASWMLDWITTAVRLISRLPH